MSNSKAVCFRVIKDFAPERLQKLLLSSSEKEVGGILFEAVRDAGLYNRVDLANDPPPISYLSVKDMEDNANTFIPLIICDDRESLKRKGIMCPYEFVIERGNLIPIVDDGQFISCPVKILTRRLQTLAELYSGTNFKEALRDWFAGAFRMCLMLDATTHGTSQYVDIERVREGKDRILRALAKVDSNPDEQTVRNAAKLRERFCGCGDAEVDKFLPLAKIIFCEYFCTDGNKSITGVLNDTKLNPDEKHKILCQIYTDSDQTFEGGNTKSLRHDERLPLSFGDRAKYVTPAGKLNLLLIDDNVDQSPFYYLAKSDNPSCPNHEVDFSSTISKDDWTLLCDIFNVQTMSVDQKDGDIYKTAVRRFREFHNKGLTFDLILVDLCLGNNRQGADLDGYAMIRIVKVFFPGTPIVVYSRFRDMEHIARAFFSGAKWFLVKGEEAKLPRHVLKLLKQVGWHREWRSVKTSSHAPIFLYDYKKDDFSRRFDRTEQWKYLTYKSLEYFPGKFITVKKMGGGISSAVTFKATKGVKLGGEFLQTPCIIKIDSSYNTMMEFERYFRMVRPYIANECGRVEKPERVLNRTYSSIVYTFAGKQDKAHTLESMGDMLDDNVACQTACDYETYRYALNCIFDEILPKIHRVSPELEFADIEKSSVLVSEVMDAFAWEDKPLRKSSFPNYYFCEFTPSEFWKSYMFRMQPWGRIKVDYAEIDGASGLFYPQQIVDIPKNTEKDNPCGEDEGLAPGNITLRRMIFHNVMTDPFSLPKPDDNRPDSKPEERAKKAGQRIIEAYTEDRRLFWLEGDVCDFAARFRKQIFPGTSLWVGDSQLVPDIDTISGNDCKGRIEWLEDTFHYKGKDIVNAKYVFVSAIAELIGIHHEDYENKSDTQIGTDLEFYTKLQDAVMGIAKQVAAKAKEWNMKCPIGIVHGDLNVKNIMLESRKHPPKEGDMDVTKSVSDVWLIDFARTRRDIIAHDFNVFFTSVLGELFSEKLIGKDGKKNSRQVAYFNDLANNFRIIVSAAVDPESKNKKGIPDEIKGNRRYVLIYRMLRRTHDAALAAGVSQNMYLLTTALACLYTLKIFLNNGCKVRLAAAYFAAAWICYDLICESIGVDNRMNDSKEEFRKGFAP